VDYGLFLPILQAAIRRLDTAVAITAMRAGGRKQKDHTAHDMLRY